MVREGFLGSVGKCRRNLIVGTSGCPPRLGMVLSGEAGDVGLGVDAGATTSTAAGADGLAVVQV